MTFNIFLNSTGYSEVLSQAHTCDGQDTSPEITWQDPPASVKSYILIMEDPDARHGPFVHWVMYNIKPDAKGIPENMPKTETTPEGWAQGLNSFGKLGYNGPCPPRKQVHRYNFILYALNVAPELPPGLKKNDLSKIISDKTVKQASVMVRYGRSYQ